MLTKTTTTILFLASLASCSPFAGDFCDLAERLVTDEETARMLLARDRALVVQMNVQNKLLDRCK